MKRLLFGTILLISVIALPIPTIAGVDVHVSIPLPPPIPFPAPPEVVVIPETYVYAVPDVREEIFFYNGWWWRPWRGHWYRSRRYNSGWVYYQSVPSFYRGIPPGWRNYYRDHRWKGHPWDYHRIPHGQVERNWSSWEKSRHWEKQQTWGVHGLKPRAQSQPPTRSVKSQSKETVKPEQSRGQSREVQAQHSQIQSKHQDAQQHSRQGKPQKGEADKQDKK